MENWRDIPGYEGYYQASDQGRIRSLQRAYAGPADRETVQDWQAQAPRSPKHVLAFSYETHGGRRRVALCKHGEVRVLLVHRLVLMAFQGMPAATTPVARHLNGDHLDNRPGNLQWGTMVENAADAIAHGRTRRGEASPRAKLTEADVRTIRASDASQRDLAARFGVSQPTIGGIIRRRTWGHIE